MNRLTRRQPPNRRVVLATVPCIAGSVYFFGWRSLVMVLVSCAVAFLAELCFCRRRKEPVSEAAFVTAILFALILPATAGWHILVVGILVAIVLTKEVFGGFGRNVFNPAMAGRCFVYICFPVAMTGIWAPNAMQLPGASWHGALDRWSTQHPTAKPGQAVNAFTGATPLGVLKEKQLQLNRAERKLPRPAEQTEAIEAVEGRIAKLQTSIDQVRPRISQLLLGNIGGTMGVTSALLILIGGLYLFITKTANRTIILSVVISCAALSQTLHMFGVPPSSDAVSTVLSGGFLFGAFFMATDPISAAKTQTGRIICGCIIGMGRVIIQNFSAFNGGFMFALLLANMFAPSIDHIVRQRTAAKKARAAVAQPVGEAKSA